MLTEKYKSFIEKTSTNLISSYEKATNNKYNPNDFNSVLGVIHFLNGDLIYVDNLNLKYKTDEMLFIQNNNSFIIIVDKKHIEEKTLDIELDMKKVCFRMLWMYINNYIDNIAKKDDISSNKIIYPKDCSVNSEDLLKFIRKNSKQRKKILKLERK